jgi:hypothetical protein
MAPIGYSEACRETVRLPLKLHLARYFGAIEAKTRLTTNFFVSRKTTGRFKKMSIRVEGAWQNEKP